MSVANGCEWLAGIQPRGKFKLYKYKYTWIFENQVALNKSLWVTFSIAFFVVQKLSKVHTIKTKDCR